MSEIKMTSGQHNTIVLDKNNRVWCFGHNQYGQNGNGKKTGMDPNPYPELAIPSWGDAKIVDLCAGHNHTVALDENGKLWYWGWDNYGMPPFPGAKVIGGKAVPEMVTGWKDADGNEKDVKIVQVTGGGWHVLALDSEGQLWAWGSNLSGQIGIKGLPVGMSAESACFTPTLVDVLPEGIKVKSIISGGQHVGILDENGDIWTYGWNQYGQLGSSKAKTGLNAYEVEAVKVEGLDDKNIVKISASYYHMMALDDNGKVYAWGGNQYGQLGNKNVPSGPDTPHANSVVPVPVDGLDVEIVDIAAGYAHSVVLDKNGGLWSWGYNLYGQVGVPNVSNGDFSSYVKEPMKLTEWKDERGQQMDVKIATLMCLTNHTMAVDTNDNVWGWGFNRYGQLGNGLSDDINMTPQLVMWPVGSDVSPEPASLAHVTVTDDNGALDVEQIGYKVTVRGKFDPAEGMLKNITIHFNDAKKSGIFTDINKEDVRIFEDRPGIAFASHTHMDYEKDAESNTVSMGLKLRATDDYTTPKTMTMRFVHSYNEYDMPVDYDVYTLTFIEK